MSTYTSPSVREEKKEGRGGKARGQEEGKVLVHFLLL
jgi:hypothetical protein